MKKEGFLKNIHRRGPNSIILHGRIEGGQSPELTFEKAIEKGINDALARIKMRFENSENPLDNLAYHNTRHTADVIRRTREILGVLVPNDSHLIRLGQFIAANHDTVQDYDVVEGDGRRMRKRHRGDNEEASAEEALAYLKAFDEKIFTQKDRELVEAAIHVTVPDFIKNEKEMYETVVQPYLSDASELLVRAVALADLGTAGMDGPEYFIEEGDALFREENIDVGEALERPEELSEIEKEAYVHRMLTWSDGQVRFARGRQALFDKEIEGLTEDQQRAVAKLFSEFDESVQGSQARADMRKGKIDSGEWTFEDLARDFGYQI